MAESETNNSASPEQPKGTPRDNADAEELEKWLSFMKTMLGCLDHNIYVEACSISLVPEQLRRPKEETTKSQEEAYMPQVVSIGPLHKGTRPNLLYMEDTKWRCLLHLLKKRPGQAPMKVLKNCGEAMLMLDEIIRASYSVEVKFNRNELAQIMVLDGCFLLELFMSSSESHGPGVEVVKREKVLSDLMILENQIPFVVLQTLSNILLFPPEVDIPRWIYERALSILGYSPRDFTTIYTPEFKAFHFLELVHLIVGKEKDETKEKERLKERKDVKLALTNGSVEVGKLKLQRCATRLKAAGVIIIKPSETMIEASSPNMAAATRFNLQVKFSNGKLEIQPLHITETTEVKWRNLIAWELNRTTLEKQRGMREEDRISCQFISYALFFRGLICSIHDVQLLRDRKVIEVHNGKDGKKVKTNEELLNLFRNITEGVPEAEIDMDTRFGDVILKLNSYTTTKDGPMVTCYKGSIILWHSLRCFATWIRCLCIDAYGVLRSVYLPSGWALIAVLAAAAGLALTATQTHYSIHSK